MTVNVTLRELWLTYREKLFEGQADEADMIANHKMAFYAGANDVLWLLAPRMPPEESKKLQAKLAEEAEVWIDTPIDEQDLT